MNLSTLIRKWSSLTLLILLTACQTFTDISLSFSEQEIKKWVSKSFPIQKQDKLYTITLQNPRISLQEGSDRIGLALSLDTHLLEVPFLSVHLSLEGQLLYKPEKRTLYLTQFVIRELSFSENGARAHPTLRLEPEVTALLQQELKEIPLYSLDKHLSKKSYTIRQVTVKNGRLIVVLSF